MSEQGNYRIISNKPLRIYDYFKTQQELHTAMETQTNRSHTAEFYQPGIGWVRYNPQPVDYAEIIRRLVAAGDEMASLLSRYATSRQSLEAVEWDRVCKSAEVKKVLGEA